MLTQEKQMALLYTSSSESYISSAGDASGDSRDTLARNSSQGKTTSSKEDLIIQKLLENRPVMTDVEEEYERERQRRMVRHAPSRER